MTYQQSLPTLHADAPSHAFVAPRGCELVYDHLASVVHIVRVTGKRRHCFHCGCDVRGMERERIPWQIYEQCGEWEND